MKELLTAIEYNLGMLGLRIRNLKAKANPPEQWIKAEAQERLKKINEMVYGISEMLEEIENSFEG